MKSRVIVALAFVLTLTGTAVVAHSRLGLTAGQIQALLPSSNSVPLPSPLADVAQGALASTVTVEAELSDHEELGTAWLFDSSGDFVTNAHVINSSRQLRIRDRNNHGYNVVVLGVDDVNDVAVLRATGYQGTPLPLDIADNVGVGKKLAVISSHIASGHGDIAYETLAAIHSAATTIGGSVKGVYKDMLQMSGDHIYKGNSGGPVLNDQGQVVGIATLSDADKQQISYSIPLDRVLSELQGYASG